MARYPCLFVDLDLIETNARQVCALAAHQGMSVTGVTKACCGSPEIGAAMVRGGVTALGDSRAVNLLRLRGERQDVDLVLLRTPMIGELEEVLEAADVTLQSELEVIRKLGAKAAERGVEHRIMLMVDMGDMREGVGPGDLDAVVRETLGTPGIRLHGIGMNLACMAGVIPTAGKVSEFCRLVTRVETACGVTFACVSGGNSANLFEFGSRQNSSCRINNLRVGEAILLGRETVTGSVLTGTRPDAFVLAAEVIEARAKPSVPEGRLAHNAFGEQPAFENVGPVHRTIVALGRQDVWTGNLRPRDERFTLLAAGSDHVVLHDRKKATKAGDVITFGLDYGALMSAFASPYVNKVYGKAGQG